jgi:hypothetical protein
MLAVYRGLFVEGWEQYLNKNCPVVEFDIYEPMGRKARSFREERM